MLTEATFNTKIQLLLVGNSLGGSDSLTRLIGAIENNVLSNFEWSRVGELIEMSDIINEHEKIKSFKRPLEILYNLKGSIDGDKLKYLKTAILREADIRLFNCDLKIAVYEKNSILIL